MVMAVIMRMAVGVLMRVIVRVAVVMGMAVTMRVAVIMPMGMPMIVMVIVVVMMAVAGADAFHVVVVAFLGASHVLLEAKHLGAVLAE